jgi:hypothetical protein
MRSASGPATFVHSCPHPQPWKRGFGRVRAPEACREQVDLDGQAAARALRVCNARYRKVSRLDPTPGRALLQRP